MQNVKKSDLRHGTLHLDGHWCATIEWIGGEPKWCAVPYRDGVFHAEIWAESERAALRKARAAHRESVSWLERSSGRARTSRDYEQIRRPGPADGGARLQGARSKD
jgi:hypothetical protein